MNKLREVIGQHLNYTFNFDFVNLVESIIDRIENIENCTDDEIVDAIETSLVYCSNEWVVAKFYNSSPSDMNWQNTLEKLYLDVFAIIEKFKQLN